MGDRLDSIYEAVNKGSHEILNKEEADRYVIYTYLLIGDIVSLLEKKIFIKTSYSERVAFN